MSIRVRRPASSLRPAAGESRQAGDRGDPKRAAADQHADPGGAAARAEFVNQNRTRLSFDFFPGRPSPALFPLKTWRRLLQSNLSHGGSIGLSQYSDPAGLPALRWRSPITLQPRAASSPIRAESLLSPASRKASASPRACFCDGAFTARSRTPAIRVRRSPFRRAAPLC